MNTTKDFSKFQKPLLTWKDILPWQRDNHYILTGYRKASFSYIESIKSVWSLHNETGASLANIWSHLLGALLFISFLYHLPDYSSVWSELENSTDAFILALYNLCVAVCFVLSTTFHTFSDHSQKMHRFGNELDHLGIVLVMWGSGISSNHFGFYCNDFLRHSYLILLTATSLACAAFTLRPKFRQPSYRTARFFMYVFLGSSLLAPCVHGIWIYGWQRLNIYTRLDHFIGLALINFLGATIYAARVPERWFPETFDYLGQSHNWMHVLVFSGAMIRLRGLIFVVEYWSSKAQNGDVCAPWS